MKKFILFILFVSLGCTLFGSPLRNKQTTANNNYVDEPIAFGCFALSCGTVVTVFGVGGGQTLSPDQTVTLWEALDHVYCPD